MGACNLAFVDLLAKFPNSLSQPGKGVHAPTLLSALGGVAGVAVQMALRVLINRGERATEGLVRVETKDGRELWFGDPINNLLTMADPAICSLGLWPLVAGATVQSGVPINDLPSLEKQFGVVTARIGTSEEGFPDVDASSRPALPAGELVKLVWPLTNMIMQQAYPERPGPLGPVPQELWATVLFCAAGQILPKTAAVLSPPLGLAILMQSAIYGSKLSPKALT